MYRRSLEGWMKHIDFMALDILCLHIAFLIAYILRQGLMNPYVDKDYFSIAIVFTLTDIVVLYFFDTLKNVIKRGYYREFAVTFRHVCLVEMVLTFYLFSVKSSEAYSRSVFWMMGGLYLLLTYITRLALKKHLKEKRSQRGERALLIVTERKLARETIENIKETNYGAFHIAGLCIVDQDCLGKTISSTLVVANMDTLIEYTCREWVDEVFIHLEDKEDYTEELMQRFTEMGITAHVALTKIGSGDNHKQLVEKIGSYTALSVSINYITYLQAFLKRVFDILGGLAGCFLTLILAVIIGPMIYLRSPGPIFFSQVRVGKNGRQFRMYKFRSMYMDAEERKKELEEQNRVKDGMMFKLDYDPRIIGCTKLPDGTVKKGIGNHIRDWSLDEFPQFFNVLKGDMSLVGTRPPTVDEWERYEPRHRARLAVKPGLTGMWQVSGRSNVTDFEEVVRLDTKYINEWSMGLDLRILGKTVAVILKRDGAM